MTVESCLTTSPNDSGDFSTRTFPLALPLLALDIGGKRIGVAVCDGLGMSTRGIACLHRKDVGWTGQVLKLAREYGCRGVIAGLPRNMDGTEGGQAIDCRAAVNELAARTDLPVVFQDERLSSWTARERLFARGLSEKKVRAKIDQTAAAVILEDFVAAHPEMRK